MSSTNITDETIISLMSPVERQVKFYLLVLFLVPSLLCTIFIFRYFQWRHLQTQIYGFLLLVNGLIISVELPVTLYFLHEGTIHFESRCSAWITINYSLFQLSIYLMTWTSVERYLFIYHEHFILRHTILLHYGPIFILFLYCPLLYCGIVLLHTCQPVYNVNLYVCGGPCYSFELTLGLLDWVGNGISMEMTTLFINILIILRHFIQRYKMKKAIITTNGRQQWHRSIKLSAQLLAIGLLYVIAWLPYSLIVLIQMFKNSQELSIILSRYFAYLPYFQSLLLPFICILFMPDVKRKLFALVVLRKNQIQPIHITLGTTKVYTRTLH